MLLGFVGLLHCQHLRNKKAALTVLVDGIDDGLVCQVSILSLLLSQGVAPSKCVTSGGS